MKIIGFEEHYTLPAIATRTPTARANCSTRPRAAADKEKIAHPNGERLLGIAN